MVAIVPRMTAGILVGMMDDTYTLMYDINTWEMEIVVSTVI